jgi:hypothetical protein
MKKLVVALVLFTTLGFGQKSITVTCDTAQNIKWPIDLSLRQAEDANAVEYPNYTVGRNIFTFDLLSKTISIKHGTNIIKIVITKYIKSGSDYIFEFKTENCISPGKILLTRKINEEYTMVVQYSVNREDSTFCGYFSKNIGMTLK